MRKFDILLIIFVVFLAAFAFAAQNYEQHKHKAFDVTCTECHETEKPTAAPSSAAQCFTCHGSYEDLAAATNKLDPNPHYTHLGDMLCGECHKIHGPSVNMCATCHNIKLNIP